MSMLPQKSVALAAQLTSLVVLLFCPGCGGGSQETASEHGPPWVTLDDSAFGISSSGGVIENGKPLADENGNPVIRFSVKNEEFNDLLADISGRFESAIVVRPAELAERGISIDAQGSTAQAVLEDLAKQCKLELESLDEKKWRLSLPNSADAPEKTIKYEEE